MIYIYHCYGGTHSSSMAAEIHLGKLKKEGFLDKEDVFGVAYFDQLKTSDMGALIFRGTDEEGNLVYTLGRGASKVVALSMENLLHLLHSVCGLKERIVLSNMSPSVPLPMTFGGLFSRRLGIKFIGRPLLVKGARAAHPHIVQIVERTRTLAKQSDQPILSLTNKDLSD